MTTLPELEKQIGFLSQRLSDAEDKITELQSALNTVRQANAQLSNEYEQIHLWTFETLRDSRFNYLQNNFFCEDNVLMLIYKLESIVAEEYGFKAAQFRDIRNIEKIGRPDRQKILLVEGARVCFYILHKVLQLRYSDIQYMYRFRTYKTVFRHIEEIDFYLQNNKTARKKVADILKKWESNSQIPVKKSS